MVVERAMLGEPWAINFYADRTEGKARTPIDLDVDKHVSLEEVAAALRNHYTVREEPTDGDSEVE